MNKKKIVSIISLVLSSVLFCASCAVVVYAMVSKPEPESEYVFNVNGVEICGLAIPEVNFVPVTNVIENTDSRAVIAERLRNNTDSVFDSLKKSDIGNGVTQYSFDGSAVRIDVSAGYGGFGCNRSYYYNYGIMYMADMYIGTEHEKMYFSENVMYAHTDTDTTTKSNAFEDNAYNTIAKFALYEGYSFIE